MKVVRIDNYCRDYRPEYQVSDSGLTPEEAAAIAKQRNDDEREDSQDFYLVVEDSYVCCAGFEP